MAHSESSFTAYFDLDRTCYDTDSLRIDLFADIARRANMDPQTVTDDAKQFKIHPKFGGYEYEQHVVSYGLGIEDSWQSVRELVASKDYLFPGAAALIESVRQAGLRARILTYGERKLQMIKIQPYLGVLAAGSGEATVGYDIIREPKATFFAKLPAGQTGCLLDDVAGQYLPKNFTEIHFSPQARLKSVAQTMQGYQVSDYAQAAEAIHLAAQKV